MPDRHSGANDAATVVEAAQDFLDCSHEEDR